MSRFLFAMTFFVSFSALAQQCPKGYCGGEDETQTCGELTTLLQDYRDLIVKTVGYMRDPHETDREMSNDAKAVAGMSQTLSNTVEKLIANRCYIPKG